MALLLGHLVGDYIFQTDWMATRKKQQSLPCLLHCLLYALAVWLFTGWPAWALGVVVASHFVVDRTGLVLAFMRVTDHGRFAAPPLGPWSVILTDNIFHLLVLYGLAFRV